MANDRKKRLLITGGHAGSTAYAVISEIKRQKKDWSIFFIGGKSSLEGKKARVLHSISLSESEVEFYNITTGRLQRKFTRWSIPSALKIPIGFLQSMYLLLKIGPDVVLSFGGYAAFPVVVSSWFLRKKIIIHEQTAAAGRANIYSARFADKIALSRESSRSYFPFNKSVLTGNPISPAVSNLPKKSKLGHPPAILITGGASGSKTINDTVDKILEKLLKDYKLIHQTGDLQKQYFDSRKRALPDKQKKRYIVRSIVPSRQWPKLLRKADLLISRSGANIVAELLCVKIPSVLVPLPIAYLDEQEKNARLAKDVGLAEVLLQKELDPDLLYKTVNEMVDNWESYIDKVEGYESPDIKASQKLITEVEALL